MESPLEFILKESMQDLAPAWARRAGYPDSDSPEGILPDGLLPIPLSEAPPFSLDTLYCTFASNPMIRDSKGLAGLMEKLSPGGTALFILKHSDWKGTEMEKICEAGGMQIRTMSSIRFIDRPLSTFSRKLIQLELALIKKIRISSGKYIILSIRNQLPQSVRTGSIKLSVVLPALQGHEEEFRQRMLIWYSFFQTHYSGGDTEILLVQDDPLDQYDDVLPERENKNTTVEIIRHYRPSGFASAVSTGLLHACGKRILLDMSVQNIMPLQMIPMLAPFIRSEINRVERSTRKPRKVNDAPGAVCGVRLNQASTGFFPKKFRARILSLFGQDPSIRSEFILFSNRIARKIGFQATGERSDFLLKLPSLISAESHSIISVPLYRSGVTCYKNSDSVRLLWNAKLKPAFGGITRLVFLAFFMIGTFLIPDLYHTFTNSISHTISNMPSFGQFISPWVAKFFFAFVFMGAWSLLLSLAEIPYRGMHCIKQTPWFRIVRSLYMRNLGFALPIFTLLSLPTSCLPIFIQSSFIHSARQFLPLAFVPLERACSSEAFAGSIGSVGFVFFPITFTIPIVFIISMAAMVAFELMGRRIEAR